MIRPSKFLRSLQSSVAWWRYLWYVLEPLRTLFTHHFSLYSFKYNGNMCLVWSWKTEFFAREIFGQWPCDIFSFFNGFLNQTAWKTHEMIATYLASQVDSVTIGCFFGMYEKQCPMKNTNPIVFLFYYFFFKFFLPSTSRCQWIYFIQPSCNLERLSSTSLNQSYFWDNKEFYLQLWNRWSLEIPCKD